MTVEKVTFLNSLKSDLPRKKDLIKEGDDHIRNIKASLKLTFPNFNSRITVSSEALNSLTKLVSVDTDTNTLKVAGPVQVTDYVSESYKYPLDMGGNQIKNVGAPTEAGDVVTLGALGSTALTAFYPVGAIWMTTTPPKDGNGNDVKNGNPNLLFGGTWNYTDCQGRVLIGVGTLADGSGSPARTFTSGQIGGAYTHKLLTSEMPIHTHGVGSLQVSVAANGNHSHTVYSSYDDGGRAHHIGHGSQQIGWTTRDTSVSGSHTHSATISGTLGNAGGDQPHNIMQPYYAVYIWRRTA